MAEKIYVTGAGIVSAIGVGKAETLASLMAGKTGIREMRYLSSCHRDIPVGEVPCSNQEMMQRLGIADDLRLTRTALIGRLALREALDEAQLSGEALSDVHLISGTTVGGMDRRELFQAQEADCDPEHAQIAAHSCATCTEMIASQFGHFASLSTVSTACSSATNAIMTGANMLRCGLAERVVAGGSESLSAFHLNGFNTLMILDREQCKPFDQNRAGLNLGEGAAFLVLETEQSLLRRGVKPLCELSGFGNACDAFHQTASSPEGEGAVLAMTEALAMAGLQPSDIDYINAHGTGTPNNDESESHAIRRVFGSQLPPVSSTKAFTGHTTSASGSIEAVMCILALQHQFLPVNANWHTPMEGGIRPVTDPRPHRELRHIQSNAFGFGGNDSSLILSQVTPSNLSNPSNLANSSNPSNLANSSNPSILSTPSTPLYIRSAQQISIQQPLSLQWMDEPLTYTEPLVHALNPAFRDYISGSEVRRMGNILKRALVTSLKVLADTGIEHPDAIITGTCYGCMDCTEKFLAAMVENGEQMLSPTHFMQSTHNTVGSTLGIYTKTHGYNTTYSHGGTSFDWAVLDASMQMRQGKITTALVGGHDEMLDSFYPMHEKIGYVGQPGMVPCGEVAMSMMLSTEHSDADLCQLVGIRILHRPSLQQLASQLDQLLAEAGMTRDDLSAVMTGVNGNAANDRLYASLVDALLPGKPRLRYKHLFGENYTVSALGLYAAAHCLKRGTVLPALYDLQTPSSCGSLRSLLLINQANGEDYSLVLIKG